ncbi:MAG: DUF4249 domain-containing protein [Bacteroidia bacterium]|nr:DUF4249 domain-containing protein [Bacteroidia bacterium]
MKRTNTTLFSFFWVVLLIACRQTVGIKAKDFNPEISVYNFSESGKIPVFYLTETQSYFGYAEQIRTPEFIRNAIITLSGNGQSETLKEYLRYETNICGHIVNGDSALVRYYKGEIALETGKEYTLTIQHNNREATAKMSIPLSVPIHHLTESRQKDPEKNDTIIAVSVFIQDEAGKQNFYRLVRRFISRTICKNPVTGVKDTIYYSRVRYSSIFTDKTQDINLDGGLLERTFSLRQSSIFSDTLTFELQHLTPELAAYLMTVREQEKDYDFLPDDIPDFLDELLPDSIPDPFVEPTILKSNIENGIGCFGGASVSERVGVRIY